MNTVGMSKFRMQRDLTVASDKHKSTTDPSSHALFPPGYPPERSCCPQSTRVQLQILAVQGVAWLPHPNDFNYFQDLHVSFAEWAVKIPGLKQVQ